MFEYTQDQVKLIEQFRCPICGLVATETEVEELYLNQCVIAFSCGECDHEWTAEYSIYLKCCSPVV